MKLSFHTLDVFTATPFEGNPLAVVLDAGQLTDARMLTICREFNLSETTFVMPPENPANTAKVRIFCPGGEMPFAGHPTIGTAILLAEMKHKPGCAFETEVRLELNAGLTPVKVSRIGSAPRAMLTAPRLPTLQVTAPFPAEAVAQALNVPTEAIGFENHRVSHSIGGLGFLLVPLASRAALAAARITEPHWQALRKSVPGVDAAYLYTKGGDHPETHYRARMYAPDKGVTEDPATGSATVQMAAQLLRAEGLRDGSHRWRFEQGYDMGRPSKLELEVDVAGGALTQVRLAGQAVQIMQGMLQF